MTNEVDPRIAAVKKAIADLADDQIYVCTRVWEAWQYNTMGEGDFVPLGEEDDVLEDLAGDVLLALDSLKEAGSATTK